MGVASAPQDEVASKVLPAPLLAAIRAVFAANGSGITLVGGTALAGFFAGHRRSDDMDLFTIDGDAQKMAVYAVKSITEKGVRLAKERQSPHYYHAVASWNDHDFTIDVVIDQNLFRVGKFQTSAQGITVASLETLLKMKLATLVSRCSEKDLFDLAWLFEHYRHPDVSEIIKLAKEIDGGFDSESALISIAGATPRIEACNFSVEFGVTPEAAHRRVLAAREGLLASLIDYLTLEQPTPKIGKLIRALRPRNPSKKNKD